MSKDTDRIEFITNMVKTAKGNGIKQGEELLIRVKNAEIVTGIIKHKGSAKLIDQSHARDEDLDVETINFKLKRRKWLIVRPLEKGLYELIVWWWDRDTLKGGHFRDEFEII